MYSRPSGVNPPRPLASSSAGTATGDAAAYSFVLRGYVRHWLNSVWAEYDRAGVADLVSVRPKIAVA